jgi:Type VI secretion system/phage-baseplate injector OB domain
MTKYYGKYRGVVVNNLDPLQQGRIQVTIPDVTLPPSTWAMPSFPVAGIQAGAWMLPNPGTGVWVEFEQGDADHPVWSGCWYGSAAEVPALVRAAPPVTPPIVMQTQGQTTLMLSDVPGPTGGILLKTTTGAFISINETGIFISNGKGATIALVGPTITMNQTALVVT